MSSDHSVIDALAGNCVWNLSESDAAASKLPDCSITFRRPDVMVVSVSDDLDITGTFKTSEVKSDDAGLGGSISTADVESIAHADAADVASGKAFAEFLAKLKSFALSADKSKLTLISAAGDKKTFEKELNEY